LTERCRERGAALVAETAFLSEHHRPVADCPRCAAGNHERTGDQTRLSVNQMPIACQAQQMPTSAKNSKPSNVSNSISTAQYDQRSLGAVTDRLVYMSFMNNTYQTYMLYN